MPNHRPNGASVVKRNLVPVMILGLGFGTGVWGSEAAKLPNGQTFQVDMTGGKPVLNQAEGFRIRSIRPEVIRYTQPLRCVVRWRFEIVHPTWKLKTIEIRSLNDPSCRTAIEPQNPGDQLIKERPVTALTFSAFDRETSPLVWKGFNQEGDYWAGFAFKVVFAEPGRAPLQLTQFVKLYPREVKSVLSDLDACQGRVEASRTIHRLSLPTGEIFLVATIKGEVEHSLNEAMRVVALTPVLLPDPNAPTKARLVWVLEGRLRWEGDQEVLLQSPQVPDLQEVGKLKGAGPFRMIFAQPDRCPQMWSWLSQGGDTWLPFRIQVKRLADGQALSWVEWVLIPERVKGRVRDLLQFKG